MNVEELKAKHTRLCLLNIAYEPEAKIHAECHTEASIDYAIAMLENVDKFSISINARAIIQSEIKKLKTLKNNL